VTVMIDRFFGVHPELVRGGLFVKLKEGEIRLYMALMERSEYYCTRELTITDEQLRELVGAAPRTLCNARKKLQELGLIQYRRSVGNKYVYVICDPKTKQPYPGDPKIPIVMPKRPRSNAEEAPSVYRRQEPQKAATPPQSHGVPLKFD